MGRPFLGSNSYKRPVLTALEKYQPFGYVSAKKLSEFVGISDRQLRDVVQTLRKEGVPILSTNAGYKIAESKQEANESLGRLAAHGQSIQETAHNLRKAVDKYFRAPDQSVQKSLF